jgi:hypothetical protein
MLARSHCLILSAMFLASASADPGGVGDTVTVETNIVHKTEGAANKTEGAPKKERRPVDRIWSGVILATNPETPKPIPKELREYEASLKRTFGYSQFEIVGTATEPVDEGSEHWLLPVRSFSLEVKARRATAKDAQGGYILDLQLFHVKRPLVSSEVKLGPGSPIFIRGPGCGEGHLLIILKVQH